MNVIGLPHLVDTAERTVSPRLFVDPDIYRAEQENIFTQCWLYVGHESQIERPGDFQTGYMGEEPVILCRDPDGRIRVFLNSCRHRGMTVCQQESGNTRAFQCPYHGWTYGLRGNLAGVPDHATAYHGELDRAQWGLIEVAQVAVYHGLIFATFSARAPSLKEYLGELGWYLDMVFDRTAGGMRALPGTHRWTLNANWKFGAEQFLGDNYHTAWAHKSQWPKDVRMEYPHEQTDYEVRTKEGHGWINFQFPNPPQLEGMLRPYWDWVRGEASKRLSPLQVEQIGCVHVGTIFPNLSVIGFLGFLSVRLWQPRGPHRMDAWSWQLIERDAPEQIVDFARDVLVRTFSPSGIFEQDDGEMWSMCTETLKGPYRRRFPLNYQMGAGHSHRDSERPGELHKPPTEIGVFGFYERWRELMENGLADAR
jgi:phenylpropionate dioxygenase-like ring-hydroxylating dioxygenase large terminal subunit